MTPLQQNILGIVIGILVFSMVKSWIHIKYIHDRITELREDCRQGWSASLDQAKIVREQHLRITLLEAKCTKTPETDTGSGRG